MGSVSFYALFNSVKLSYNQRTQSHQDDILPTRSRPGSAISQQYHGVRSPQPERPNGVPSSSQASRGREKAGSWSHLRKGEVCRAPTPPHPRSLTSAERRRPLNSNPVRFTVPLPAPRTFHPRPLRACKATGGPKSDTRSPGAQPDRTAAAAVGPRDRCRRRAHPGGAPQPHPGLFWDAERVNAGSSGNDLTAPPPRSALKGKSSVRPERKNGASRLAGGCNFSTGFHGPVQKLSGTEETSTSAQPFAARTRPVPTRQARLRAGPAPRSPWGWCGAAARPRAAARARRSGRCAPAPASTGSGRCPGRRPRTRRCRRSARPAAAPPAPCSWRRRRRPAPAAPGAARSSPTPAARAARRR